MDENSNLSNQSTSTLKYNIAEYMFYINTNQKVKIKQSANVLKTINTSDYGKNYWEFTKKRVIWARKGDNIKNQIDYDNLNKEKQNREYKISMFDKLNKFKQYDSLEIKNNRKILNS